MKLFNFSIYTFFLFTFYNISFSQEIKENTVEKFEGIISNLCNIVESRYVIKFNKAYSADTLYQVLSRVINNYFSLRIVRKYLDPEGSGPTPAHYRRGSFLYSNRYFFLCKIHHNSTTFIIDSSGKYLCLWSFKTDNLGYPLKSAERKTRKISNMIIKELNDGEIIEILKVKGQKREYKVKKKDNVRKSSIKEIEIK